LVLLGRFPHCVNITEQSGGAFRDRKKNAPSFGFLGHQAGFMETPDVFHGGRLADFAKRGHLVDAQRIVSLQKADNLDSPMIGQAGHHPSFTAVSCSHQVNILIYCQKSICRRGNRIFRKTGVLEICSLQQMSL
jgi:hypothetical protein